MKDVASLKSIPENGFTVSKHDTNELAHCPAMIFCGGAGNLKVKTAGGQDLTLTGVLAGTFVPLKVVMVYSTDTTCTNMTALY